jgi:ABC-type multidrug transport system ATPase subunit
MANSGNIKKDSKSPSCHLRWTNIIKTVELKETSTGLIKSTLGGGGDGGDTPDGTKHNRPPKGRTGLRGGRNHNVSDEANAANNNNTTTQESVVAPPSHKIILNQVSGQAKAGEILALMGPSGSGKTSLLDVLAGRSVYQEGQIFLNHAVITNAPSKVKALKRKIAYIKQQDIFFDHLTVKDQLTYTAFLRLGDDFTKEEKQQEVNKVIQLLRLKKCQDTPIRLVSGGERKRVNIGTELLTNPSIIMLDEPTSGLDSTSAVALIELLVSLAHDHGKTVVTSIHQPSSAVFHKFDRVLFLADGCVVYYGTPSDSLVYCDRLALKCPEGYNAADHWMDLLVEDSAIDPGECHAVDGKGVGNHDDDDEEENRGLVDHAFPISLDREDKGGKEGVIGEQEGTMTHPTTATTTTTTVTFAKDATTVDQKDRVSNTSSKVQEKNGKNPLLGKTVLQKMLRKMSTLTVNKPTHLLDETKRKREEYRFKTTSKAKLINHWDVDAFAQQMEDAHGYGDDELSLSSHSHADKSKITTAADGDNLLLEKSEKKFNTSWMTQFHVLLHRSLKNSRSAILTSINITKSVALGTLTGLLWFQMPYTEETVPDRGSFLFFAITYWIFDGIFTAIFTFPMERAIIFKERASGSYHLSAYFLSKTLSEMPTRLILPSMFWTIAYWMADINPRFEIFLATLGCALLAVLAGESYGLLCGALVMDFEKAMTVMVVISLTTMAAGGFYVKNIPNFLVWIKYISPFKPGYEAAQILVFDRSVPCDGSGILAEYCNDGESVGSASVSQVLKFLGSDGTVGLNVGLLVVLVVVPRYLAFLALKGKRGAERS